MERIASFKVDHTKLEPGVYVSRVDSCSLGTCTTYDIRMTMPNKEPVMNTGCIHTLEHLGATFLRNSSEWGPAIVYFGPMGCRTGFYLIVFGEYKSRMIVGLLENMFEWISRFEGDIPGATPEECGNYKDQDLEGAKHAAFVFLERVLHEIDDEHLEY